MIMSIQQIKELLHLRIEQIDESFLRVVHAMMESYVKEQEDKELGRIIKELGPNPDWRQLSENELIARLEESRAQVERGETISMEELEQEMKAW